MSFEVFLLIVLGGNMVCAVICAFLASRSGHDPFAWVLAGGILGPFALLAMIAVASNARSAADGPAEAAHAGSNAVLLPTDGSEASLSAVRHVIDSRERIGSVTLLAVLPLEREEGARAAAGSPQRREYEEDLDDHVAESRQRLEEAGIQCDVIVRFGDPATEILRAATEGGFAQIVMGRRGRGGVAKLLLGSVSDQVVKNAPVPVTLAG